MKTEKEVLVTQALEIMESYFDVFGKDEKTKCDLEKQLNALKKLKLFISENKVTYKDVKIFNAKDVNSTIKKLEKEINKKGSIC